jgi:hypothetical protein
MYLLLQNYRRIKKYGKKENRLRRDSNTQPSPPESDALSGLEKACRCGERGGPYLPLRHPAISYNSFLFLGRVRLIFRLCIVFPSVLYTKGCEGVKLGLLLCTSSPISCPSNIDCTVSESSRIHGHRFAAPSIKRGVMDAMPAAIRSVASNERWRGATDNRRLG